MIILNRTGLRAQLCGVMLNSLTIPSYINQILQGKHFNYYISIILKLYFSHLNIPKFRIMVHNYCWLDNDQWCSFIPNSCTNIKMSNTESFRKSSSCLVENSGDNSKGLFDNYCITNSLDATEDSLIWKTQTPLSGITVILTSQNVKMFQK